MMVLGACVALLVDASTFLDIRPGSTSKAAVTRACFYMGTSLLIVADLFIATTLCYHFHTQRSPLRSRTNSAVQFFLLYTINTGLVNCLFGIAVIVTHATKTDGYVDVGLGLTLNGLCANTLMGSLNARDRFRNNDNVVEVSMRPISFAKPSLGVGWEEQNVGQDAVRPVLDISLTDYGEGNVHKSDDEAVQV